MVMHLNLARIIHRVACNAKGQADSPAFEFQNQLVCA
jgi:hypothetical protein